MGFADLLELDLDALNGLVLDVLYLVESAADHAESVGVNVGSSEDLVNGSLLSIETLLNSLKLLLQDQVSKACLLVHLVH